MVGDAALRKVFIGINTGNSNTCRESHLILTGSPGDKNVSGILYNTDGQTS